jgi:hypothetical protein
MGKIINFKKISETAPEDIITSGPWEFRRAEWKSRHFIQIFRSHWEEVKSHKEKIINPPRSAHILKGSMANTISGIYHYRDNTDRMKEVYYLAGLIDCMINQVNPLLRTDHVGIIYNKINTLKKILNVKWYGPVDQVLLPIDSRFYDQQGYRDKLSGTMTIKELYRLIRDETNDMFDILSSKYIFFIPGEGV